ncbi:MAG: N-acetylmuramoyl-L-alanine amidase [Lachnospiraceae bacterium]|nr:N-acetylmuramoyl-L-alanine amidase [Lachnospiraceae bacterium]MDD7026021.1 N-acetylmuramoyl-L-alanine amidase [Lachnospiraceae bacterium]
MGKKGIILLGQLGIILLVGTGCLLGNYRRNQAVATAGSLITKETERSTITEKTEAGLAAVMQEIIAERKATVVIDAGHGGEQPGCVVGRTMEKDVNLAIALALKEELENRGIGVILTRSGDRDVQLANRTAYAKLIFADYFVSIHCNAYSWDRSVRGFQCFYYQSEEGKKLSEEITQLVKEREIRIRQAEEAGFRVLRESAIPAILIETGYLTNYGDRTALTSGDYQRDMAVIIADGINKVLQG